MFDPQRYSRLCSRRTYSRHNDQLVVAHGDHLSVPREQWLQLGAPVRVCIAYDDSSSTVGLLIDGPPTATHYRVKTDVTPYRVTVRLPVELRTSVPPGRYPSAVVFAHGYPELQFSVKEPRWTAHHRPPLAARGRTS